jgi:hypothetical protein
MTEDTEQENKVIFNNEDEDVESVRNNFHVRRI